MLREVFGAVRSLLSSALADSDPVIRYTCPITVTQSAAATALAEYEKDAEILVRKAMQVAAEICVYTNDQFTQETIETQA